MNSYLGLVMTKSRVLLYNHLVVLSAVIIILLELANIHADQTYRAELNRTHGILYPVCECERTNRVDNHR